MGKSKVDSAAEAVATASDKSKTKKLSGKNLKITKKKTVQRKPTKKLRQQQQQLKRKKKHQ